MNGKLMTIGKFCKKLGVSQSTIRRMESKGLLKPFYVAPSGFRYYSEDQIATFSMDSAKERICIGYCRVSTPKQSNDLETQINNVKTYMIAKGYQFEIIKDIGSGINYRKSGLSDLVTRICRKEVDKVVVLYKDRLVRFGFELIELLCSLHGTTIEVIDNTEKTKEQELTDDLIQIITVFANRLYGSRSKKTKQLINNVTKDLSDNNE